MPEGRNAPRTEIHPRRHRKQEGSGKAGMHGASSTPALSMPEGSGKAGGRKAGGSKAPASKPLGSKASSGRKPEGFEWAGARARSMPASSGPEGYEAGRGWKAPRHRAAGRPAWIECRKAFRLPMGPERARSTWSLSAPVGRKAGRAPKGLLRGSRSLSDGLENMGDRGYAVGSKRLSESHVEP